MDKVILIGKEAGWTSFDVVAKIRGHLRAQNPGQKVKVGHAGTLDPFATGLLIVLTGTETKKQDSFMKQDKEYEATLKLGYTSTTGDPEGEVSPFPISDFPTPKEPEVQKALNQFIGQIEQTPPAFSAIKIDGQRAYKLARAGKEVMMKSRNVTIYALDILSYAFPELKIKVKCSSGTYIRTLGEDIGNALGCGAYLTALRRTKIGHYELKKAITVAEYLKGNLAA